MSLTADTAVQVLAEDFLKEIALPSFSRPGYLTHDEILPLIGGVVGQRQVANNFERAANNGVESAVTGSAIGHSALRTMVDVLDTLVPLDDASSWQGAIEVIAEQATLAGVDLANHLNL